MLDLNKERLELLGTNADRLYENSTFDSVATEMDNEVRPGCLVRSGSGSSSGMGLLTSVMMRSGNAMAYR